jgi:hypothetical protein
MLENIDWVALSGLTGLIMPVLIELFAKKVHGQAKIIIVWVACLFTAFVQHGLDGGFQAWDWGQFTVTLVIILGIAINSWNQMWKKWFGEQPDPTKLQ